MCLHSGHPAQQGIQNNSGKQCRMFQTKCFKHFVLNFNKLLICGLFHYLPEKPRIIYAISAIHPEHILICKSLGLHFNLFFKFGRREDLCCFKRIMFQ